MAEHPPGGSSASESKLPTVYITVDLGAPSGDAVAGQKWEPPAPARLQRLLPGFEVQALVGRGGMGAVYRGRQTLLDRPVALKVLPPELARIQSGFADRFQTEARMLARLNHDGIVRVFDFGQTDEGHLFMAMEFVHGTTLEEKLEGKRRLPPAEALTITSQVCAALQHAHQQRVIHRDVKPSNVMLEKSGRVKLTDFGLARAVQSDDGTHTCSGPIMGTRGFVAPEVLVPGRLVDHRADIYSVGVMLYQMLTGEVPRTVPPPPASERVRDLDPRWDEVVRKAMALEPAQRYQDATALRAAIEVIGSTPPPKQEASKPAPAPAAGRRARRDKGVAGGVPVHRPRRPLFSWLVTVSVVAVAALWVWRNWEQPLHDDDTPAPTRTVQEPPAVAPRLEPQPLSLPTTPVVPAIPPVTVPAKELAILTKPAVQSIRLTTEDLGESKKRLQQILDDFSAALRQWQAAHDARLATLRAQYSRAISGAVTSTRNARQLADLAALEEEQRILASGAPLPPVEQSWAGERKRLRAIHDAEARKIDKEDNAAKVELYSRHLGALLAYQTILKQTNRTTAISMVDEVMLEARAEHDRLAKGSPGINNAPRVAVVTGRTSSGGFVFEAEDFKPAVTGGDTARESAGTASLSGGLQLAWFGGKLGDTATFTFQVPSAGRYRLEAVLTKASGHGIFRFQLNGDFIGEPAYDLHTPGAPETITHMLHEGSLAAGNQELKVRVMDTNRSGPRQYGFAMDCLRLVPVP